MLLTTSIMKSCKDTIHKESKLSDVWINFVIEESVKTLSKEYVEDLRLAMIGFNNIDGLLFNIKFDTIYRRLDFLR